jgi:hypothetical protein
MKAGNGAGFAPGSTRARKRDDVRRRVDATRDMRNFVSTISAVFFATHSHTTLTFTPIERAYMSKSSASKT